MAETELMPAPGATPDADRRRAEVEALGPWFHNLHLPDGTQTLPHHFLGGDFPSFKWRLIEPYLPPRLDGWRVLDVGCNAGFYTFEFARRGAEVLAVDVDPHYLRQARWAAREIGVEDRIEFRQAEVYELAALDETFDLVWFMGVFYHLRYPLLGLDILARKTRRLLMFQTLGMPGQHVYPDTEDHEITERRPLLDVGWPKMAFVEHRFSGDPTNWWIANHAGCEAMLRSTGLRVVGRPADEMYLCAPADDAAERRAMYASQLDAITRMAGPLRPAPEGLG